MRLGLLVPLILCLTNLACSSVDTEAVRRGGAKKEHTSANKSVLWKHLAAIPAPAFDQAAAVDWWESFVETYTNRVHGSPSNVRAAEYLRRELATAGYSARVIEYPSSIGTVRVVEGMRDGVTHPSRVVGLIAHYDGFPGTTQAAYDNGAGVAITLSLCKLLAKVSTNKTTACLFFDAEEKGLVASKKYVTDVGVERDTGFMYDHIFSYDMVGLNLPGNKDWKLYMLVGLDTPEFEEHLPKNLAFLKTVMQFLTTLGIRTEGVEIKDVHDRSSDEESFKLAGVPVLRFTGGRKASQYDAHHTPTDTVDRVYELAGGRGNFEASYELAVLVSYYTILAYDDYDPKQLPPLEKGVGSHFLTRRPSVQAPTRRTRPSRKWPLGPKSGNIVERCSHATGVTMLAVLPLATVVGGSENPDAFSGEAWPAKAFLFVGGADQRTLYS